MRRPSGAIWIDMPSPMPPKPSSMLWLKSLKFQVIGPPLLCGTLVLLAAFLGAGFLAAAFFGAAFFAGFWAACLDAFLAVFFATFFFAAVIPTLHALKSGDPLARFDAAGEVPCARNAGPACSASLLFSLAGPGSRAGLRPESGRSAFFQSGMAEIFFSRSRTGVPLQAGSEIGREAGATSTWRAPWRRCPATWCSPSGEETMITPAPCRDCP